VPRASMIELGNMMNRAARSEGFVPGARMYVTAR
jgi:hypothetical protein